MSMRRFTLGLVLGSTIAAAAQDNRGVAAFMTALERATARGDRAAVAAMVRYPLTVSAAGVNIPVNDRAAFLRYYDGIFTDDVRRAVASGEAVRRGILRISRDGSAPKIFAINVPAGGRRVARHDTERGIFRAGSDSRQLAGALARGQRASYVVFAKRGQQLDVRIDGVRGRDVIARVVEASTGAPVDTRARDGVRAWAGRVSATGDYRIDVERVAPGGAVLAYTLIVSVR